MSCLQLPRLPLEKSNCKVGNFFAAPEGETRSELKLQSSPVVPEKQQTQFTLPAPIFDMQVLLKLLTSLVHKRTYKARKPPTILGIYICSESKS